MAEILAAFSGRGISIARVVLSANICGKLPGNWEKISLLGNSFLPTESSNMSLKLAAAVLACGLAVAPPLARAEQAPSAMAKSVPAPAELLTPEEQQALAQQDEEPAREVAGGALSNLHLTYIVIALSAAVLVLVLK
jgi:hypothetical protein